ATMCVWVGTGQTVFFLRHLAVPYLPPLLLWPAHTLLVREVCQNHTMFFTGAQWGCQGGTRVGGRWQQLTSRYTSLAGVVEAAIYEQEDSVAKHRGANSPMFRDVLLPDTRTASQTLHIGKILRRHVLV